MPVNYLNNAEFEAIIMRYRKAQNRRKKNKKEIDETKEKLAMAFFILSERLVKGFKFQLIDVDDAIMEGVVVGFEKLPHFDSKKGKAFSFYTQIILNHFKQLYRTAKAHNELQIKYGEHLRSKEKNYGTRNVKGKHKHFYKTNNDYLDYHDHTEE